MGRCQVLDLFTRHTLEACIKWMRLMRDVGKTQPAVQGLGINGKQTTTVGQRHDGHQENSFRVKQKKKQERSRRYPGRLPRDIQGESKQSRRSCFEATPAVI